MKHTPIPPASTVSVRFATRADVPTILDFIRQLAAFEREPDAVKTTEADLLRDGFGARPQLGQHNRDVLQGWLGLSDARLRELEAAGVV